MRSLVTYRSFAALTIVVISAALLVAVWDRHGAGIAARGSSLNLPPAMPAPVLTDDFNDNAVNTSMWITEASGGPTIAETNQRVEVTLPATSAGSFFFARYNSIWELHGDFDVQVDFELLTWPPANGVRIGLITFDTGSFAAMDRISLGASGEFPGQPREVYMTDFGDGLFFNPGSDLSGKLRLVRVGTTLTGYYFSGGAWVALHSRIVTIGDARFQLQAWSHDASFSDQQVKVAFDNFTVNQGQALGLSCAPPPSGLVNWWPAGGHTFDIQDGNHATLLGGAFYSAAKVGPGFAFDSDDDRVTVPHNNDLNINSPGFTAEFWMRGVKNQPQTIYNLVEKSHGFIDNTGWSFQGTSATGTVGFGVGAGGPGFTNFPGVGTGIDVLDGNFHHIAGTWDGANIRLYVDGALQGVTPLATPFNNNRAMNIGFAWGGGTVQRFFRGTVDEPGIYSRALTASEIQSIFSAGSAGKCKPFITALDSKGGFLRADSDNPAPPTIVNLASAGFAPGEAIKIRFAVQGFSFFGCGGPFAPVSQIGINGVFSNSTTLLSPPNQFRVTGAIDAGVDHFTGNTHFGGQPTDIPQDFLITPTTGAVVQIPTGATQLFIGVIDSYYQDNCGSIFIFIERSNRAPLAACQNVTVSAELNCTAAASIDNGSSDPDGNAITVTQSPPGSYPLGNTVVTLTVTDSNGASSNCTATVTVVDTTPPQVTPPANASHQCLSEVPPGNPSQATATDNCSTPTITVADASNGGAGSIASPLIITRYFTATDAASNSASAPQTITVIDNTPPVILSCPANISLAGNVSGACSATVNPGTATATDNCGAATVAGSRSDGQTLSDPYQLGVTTITWTATDAAGNQASCQQQIAVTNPNPVVAITGPTTGSVYAVGAPVTFTGAFMDNPGGTHTATWSFDAATQAGTVNETTGAVIAAYTFTSAGVYQVTLTVADGCGGSGSAGTIEGLSALVVIYDQSAGWVTGGGWINSPAGAYVPNPGLTGKANFGFVSKYQNGASVPTGNTEFHFKAGDLKFKSTSYEWMVIAGKKAQYKGFGTINGSGSYRFMLTAIDGDQPGGGGQDKFRIRIWSDDGGLVYDNQMNDPDSNDPTTVLGGGSIVIHK